MILLASQQTRTQTSVILLASRKLSFVQTRTQTSVILLAPRKLSFAQTRTQTLVILLATQQLSFAQTRAQPSVILLASRQLSFAKTRTQHSQPRMSVMMKKKLNGPCFNFFVDFLETHVPCLRLKNIQKFNGYIVFVLILIKNQLRKEPNPSIYNL